MNRRDPGLGYVPNDAYAEADWAAVDSPPLTDAELARTRPGVKGMLPAMAEAFGRRTAGQPQSARARRKRGAKRSE
ncbi:hypothetical protein FV226_22910 [Methylobacterium sp. WL12]|uniref:hypothetical protein n=1 Tax=Methylobacterium sp. WL12 TaxID=2603890 RepID=UPI0011C813D4|nr:hypothetical protein [Methylobacterium sp. WL12]TXM66849.1 hypothetical protein FV226_22910 [Methylobacterium sp. WL12]